MNKLLFGLLVSAFSVNALALDAHNFSIGGTWEVTKSYCMENAANVDIERIAYSLEITDSSTIIKDRKSGLEEPLEVVSSVHSRNGDTFVLKFSTGVKFILSSRMKMDDSPESKSPYFIKVEIRDQFSCPGSVFGSTRVDILQKTN